MRSAIASRQIVKWDLRHGLGFQKCDDKSLLQKIEVPCSRRKIPDRISMVQAETARKVVNRQREQPTISLIQNPTQDASEPVNVGCAALHVPRSHENFRLVPVLPESLYELDRMREVSVHRDENVSCGCCKAREHCTSVTTLRLCDDASTKSAGNLLGAIAGSSIQYQDLRGYAAFSDYL